MDDPSVTGDFPIDPDTGLVTVTVEAPPPTDWNKLFWIAVLGYVLYRMAKDAKYV